MPLTIIDNRDPNAQQNSGGCGCGSAGNCGGNSGTPELPVLQESDLDEVTYRSLVRDLSVLTYIAEVRVKRAGQSHAQNANVSLNEGITLLDSGDAQGLQILYRFEGQLWCDTLLRSGDGLRLLRMHGWD